MTIHIILFYKFVEIKNPKELMKMHMNFCNNLNVKGKVILAEEGINGSISGTKEHWVSGKYCVEVKRATVNTDTLNVRSGPGTKFPKISSYTKGQELFIEREEKGWCEIVMDDKWVSKDYLVF